MQHWASKIVAVKNAEDFNNLAIEAFLYQYEHVEVYREYCKKVGASNKNIRHFQDIPFLPIEFFKTHSVSIKNQKPTHIFTSSGTTGMVTSKHEVIDIELYNTSFLEAFNKFYGNIKDYCILALLPSYLERGSSSLVYMAERLIQESKHPDSGFYLHDYEALIKKLNFLLQSGQKILLLGVTYALLDIVEEYRINLNNAIIMETGGMKGKRKEMVREELHATLIKSFGVKSIHSEYGMTELLSQAYSYGNGIFQTPNWMKILIRDTYDPFTFVSQGRSGGINIIDLANINSCCFIETKDIGKKFADESFTILGRFDNSDIRGCNLLVN